MQGRSGPRRATPLCFLLLLTLHGFPGWPASPAQAQDKPRALPQWRTSACEYCRPDPEAEFRALRRQDVDSIIGGHAAVNMRELARTESLYVAGFFGPVEGKATKAAALVHWQLRTRNGIDYVSGLASANHAYHATEAELLLPLGRDYTRVTMYPLRFLREAKVGTGWFCLHYDAPASFHEETWVGGDEVVIRGEPVRDAEDAPPPAILVEWPSRMHDALDVVLQRDLCGRVEKRTVVDRGDTLEVQILSEIEGLSVRRWGVHSLSALVFWRSVVHGDRDPARPRIGACAYFPAIHLRLPSFLPDLGLQDLREFDVPQPVLRTDRYQREAARGYRWVAFRSDRILVPWSPIGPYPVFLDESFPDL